MKKTRSTIQIRIDNKLKKDATKLFEDLDIDMSTAIRIFLRRCVKNKGIPFKLDDSEEWETEMNPSNSSDDLDITLDDINKIIAKIRKEKKEKK